MGKRSLLVTKYLCFLPQEVWFEILSWLEVESLLRCKSVCKLWYALISNEHFVNLHALRSERTFHNIKYKGEIFRSCTGLVVQKILSSAMASPKYRIMNPSTQRTLDLPNPHNGVIGLGIFVNSSTSSYNVLSIYSDKDEGRVCFERIDLGGQSNDPCPSEDLSWRSFNIPEFDKLSKQQIYDKFLYFLSEEGVLYIVTLLKVGPRKPRLICFDIVTQASTILDVPQRSLGFNWPNVMIQLWGGKPALSFVFEEQLNIWVLDDYKKQKWADTIRIPLPFLKQFPDIKEAIPYPLMFCDDQEAMLVYDEDDITGCLVYKLKSQELGVVPSLPCRIPATLVCVKGMQPINSK